MVTETAMTQNNTNTPDQSANNQDKTQQVQVLGQSPTQSAHFWKNLSQLGFTLAWALMIGVVPGAILLTSFGQAPARELQAFPVAAEATPALCESAGGTWQTFPNSCAGGCEQFESEVLCIQTAIESCMCPTSQCWDGETCRSIPEPEYISDLKTQETNSEL